MRLPEPFLISISKRKVCADQRSGVNVCKFWQGIQALLALEKELPYLVRIMGRVSELASIIESRTSAIESYLESQSLNSPSFSVDTPPVLPLPTHLKPFPDDIWNAAAELQALIVGPLSYLTRLTNPSVSYYCHIRPQNSFCSRSHLF